MPDPKPLTVAELTADVKSMLENDFRNVRVAGEVSNLVRAASGHVYFSLKDGGATLRCVMFRGIALRLKFDAKDGLEVVVRGNLTVYPQRGEYQLIVEEFTPQGIGAAELALRQLREKLFKRGYFAPERKKPLPKFPGRVALIASPTGAAVRDMLEILATRWPLAEVIVRPSRVQGDGAADEVAAAVRLLNQLHHTRRLRLCAIVIGRGGGSAEDLAAFNAEVVADAVFESLVPVVSAVGHEVDVSIADSVADYRALTPSEAIVAITPDHKRLGDDLADWAGRLADAASGRVASARQRLDACADRPALRKPLERVRELEQDLDALSARLTRAGGRAVERQGVLLAAAADRLAGLSPLNVLARGYSLTRTAGGERLIRSVGDVTPGERVICRVGDGDIHADVVRVYGVDHPER